MKIVWIYITFFFLTCILLFGCGPIHPKYVPLSKNDLTPVLSSQPVRLVNDQKVKEVQVGDTMSANLTEWNEQAIRLIKEWLQNSGVRVDENAEKYLKTSVSDIIPTRTNMPCLTMTLNVETGAGAQRNYTSQGCAAGLDRSAGYAINYAVTDLMHDGSILKYLAD